MIERIDQAGDPRIAGYRDIREARLAVRDGLYVVEGEVVLRVAIAGRGRELRSVLLADNRVAGLSGSLAALPDDVPVYVAPPAVLEEIAGFSIHRGVLALGERRALPSARDVLASVPADAVVVALVGVGNHDNMGGIFRNAAAFGAAAVLVDSECCDPLYRKALRVSVGAALIVPFARFGKSDGLPSLCAGAGFRCLALSPRGRAPLSSIGAGGRVMLVLGSEGQGLPEELMTASETVRIPMAVGFDSLNVSTASGIALHHLTGADRPERTR